MRVMIGTPCALGMVHQQYLTSFLQTYNGVTVHKQQMAQQLVAQFPGGYDPKDPQKVQALGQALAQNTIELGIYTLGGESLLGRGRNHIAAAALYNGWDKLFFIDSDTGWSYEDFFAIAANPAPIVAGVVPLKTYPNSPHGFQTTLNYLPFNEDEIHFKDGLRTLESTIAMANAHGSNLVKVPFTGTAFLCIAREVFMKMAETAQEYLYPDPYTGQSLVHWSFFDGGPIADTYNSEDWSFCHKARELGYDVVIDTNVRLRHVGNHEFRAG